MFRQQEFFQVEVKAGLIDDEKNGLLVGLCCEQGRAVLVHVRLDSDQSANLRVLEHYLIQVSLPFSYRGRRFDFCFLAGWSIVTGLLRGAFVIDDYIFVELIFLGRYLLFLLVNAALAFKNHEDAILVHKLTLDEQAPLLIRS